jgi:hypothetical protein
MDLYLKILKYIYMKKIMLGLGFVFGISGYAQIPTSGLVGDYHFESSGMDASSSMNHLVGGLNNGSITYPAGFIGNGLHLSEVASCDYMVKTPFSGLTNGAFSISTWIKYEAGTSSNLKLLFTGRDALNNPVFSIEQNAGNFYTSFYTYHPGNTYTSAGIDSAGLMNGWNNLCFVFDIDSIYIYKNGIKHTSTHNPYGVLIGNTAKVQVGSQYPYCAELVILDETLLYNRALTSTEIMNIYAAPTLATEHIAASTPAMRIYPNPATNMVLIDWKKTTSIDKIELLTVDGQLIETHTSFTSYINVEKLTPGVYFIKISSGTDTYFSKLIKN